MTSASCWIVITIAAAAAIAAANVTATTIACLKFSVRSDRLTVPRAGQELKDISLFGEEGHRGGGVGGGAYFLAIVACVGGRGGESIGETHCLGSDGKSSRSPAVSVVAAVAEMLVVVFATAATATATAMEAQGQLLAQCFTE